MTPVVELKDLVVRYPRVEAVRGLSLVVEPGRCHALFGRNGAGKTSALRALLGLLRAEAGQVRLFGLDPARHEAEVKARLAWVPDAPGFHPWMTVQEVLAYEAALRPRWEPTLEAHLLARFELDREAKAGELSKGQKTQLALVRAIASDPELLVLDEPTSGLDPLVRRQFLEAVIGVFQEREPQKKAILVSTHLISEFEGVVDGFTVMSGGRAVLTSSADDARARFCRLRAWFDAEPPREVPWKTVRPLTQQGRMLEAVVDAGADEARGWLTTHGATRVDASALSLEDIFLLAA
ncbi:MAG: ABC transporter ATP-binding protein [Myxococcota bacterium]